jgi:hypothetical protein
MFLPPFLNLPPRVIHVIFRRYRTMGRYRQAKMKVTAVAKVIPVARLFFHCSLLVVAKKKGAVRLTLNKL